MNFWEPIEIERGRELHWQIGPLLLWVKCVDDELCVHSEERPDEPTELLCAVEKAPPEDAKWHRWAAGGQRTRLRLQPVMPDRSVVVKPESTK